MAVWDIQNTMKTESGQAEGRAEEMRRLMESERFLAALDRGECASDIQGEYVFWAKNIYRNGESVGIFWGANRTEHFRDQDLTEEKQYQPYYG